MESDGINLSCLTLTLRVNCSVTSAWGCSYFRGERHTSLHKNGNELNNDFREFISKITISKFLRFS
jgi:hypothetical protein